MLQNKRPYPSHQNEVNFVEGISERRSNSERYGLNSLFRICGPISSWEGGRGEGRRVLNEEARVAANGQGRSSNIVLFAYQAADQGREIEGGGSIRKGWRREGPDSGVSYFNTQ